MQGTLKALSLLFVVALLQPASSWSLWEDDDDQDMYSLPSRYDDMPDQRMVSSMPVTMKEIMIAGMAAFSNGDMVGNVLKTPVDTVKADIYIDNFSKLTLRDPKFYLGKGRMTTVPTPILPATRNAFCARSTGLQSTYGIASWLIESMNRRFVVMWSLPHSNGLYCNWMGMALTDVGVTTQPEGDAWFQQMYYGKTGNGLKLVRKRFYYDVAPFMLFDDRFTILGMMNNTHEASMLIKFVPTQINDLATPVRQELINMRLNDN